MIQADQPDQSSGGLPPSVRDDRERPWHAFLTLGVILAIEACVIGWFFGGWLVAISGKRWVALAMLGLVGGLWSHIDQHRAEYRSVRVSWPLVACQMLAFASVVAYLAWMSTGTRGPLLGEWADVLVAAAAAGVWFACSVAAIAPRPELARQLLTSGLVLAVFAMAAWSSGELTRNFWQVSGETTLQLVSVLLAPFADGPVIRADDHVIGTPSFQVAVRDSCSGFHGIGLITTLLAGYLWWFRGLHRFPQSLLLLPVGVILIWLANVIRITALILVGIWISPSIAIDGFHSVAGWIAFLTVGLGIIWSASRMPFFTRPADPLPEGAEQATAPIASSSAVPAAIPAEAHATSHTDQPASLSAAACLLPFLALTAITMLTQAFTSGFDILYPVRVVTVAAVLVSLWPELRRQEWRISPLAVAIGVVTFALWMILAPGETAATETVAANRDPMQLGQPWTALWLFFRVAGATLTVPIAEELFFRGFVSRRCITADTDSVPIGRFTWFSFLVASTAFGVLHGDAWIAGTVAGMLFAVAMYARGQLVDAIVAHATTNALLSGYVIATGSWSQWG
jgi:exosortase E/protease (VPEID-CTERM system)